MRRRRHRRRAPMVRRAIIDKNVRVPPGARIGIDPDRGRRPRFTVSPDGVVVIGKGEKVEP